VKKIIFAVCLMLTLWSCNKLDNFERTVFFPEHQWSGKNQPSFQFEIKDTVSKYNIYVVIRHEDAYHYNNLWINVITKAPNENPITQKVNLQLANNSTGWLGSGMDDVFDHRIRITNSPILLKKGVYQFSLQQIMREDPLPAILNAGIRVEKIHS
jgi:gliding motility-associated lipoprotein GldH